MVSNKWIITWIALFNLLKDKAFGGVFHEEMTGTNLSCYTCKESYKITPYDPTTHICQSNLPKVDIISCGMKDEYCKVERVELQGVKISIERGCTDTCYYGCKFQGYGLTYLKCTSCCRGRACNTDSHGEIIKPSLVLCVMMVLIASFTNR